MSGIGTLVTHARYGTCKVTNTWRKVINPVDRTTKLYALTFEIVNEKGKVQFNKDRSYNGTLNSPPLPRCFESNLKLLKVYTNEKAT